MVWQKCVAVLKTLFALKHKKDVTFQSFEMIFQSHFLWLSPEFMVTLSCCLQSYCAAQSSISWKKNTKKVASANFIRTVSIPIFFLFCGIVEATIVQIIGDELAGNSIKIKNCLTKNWYQQRLSRFFKSVKTLHYVESPTIFVESAFAITNSILLSIHFAWYKID